MIELSNLVTGYSIDKPLQKYTRIFEEDKIYGILGESGKGKTTLLRTIASLQNPLDGHVIIDGKEYKKPDKNPTFMMHQNYTLFDWLSVLENVILPKTITLTPFTKNKNAVKKEYEKEGIRLLSEVGIDEYDKFPIQLSGGQRQRVALARTLFVNPKYILMDEPLSALDVETRKKMQDLVLKNHRESHNCIILVTHSREEAEYMCDEIINI